MADSLLTQSKYKLSENIFFRYKVLRTTFGPQQFAKIRVFSFDNFGLPIILAPKLKPVEKNTNIYIFSTFGSKTNKFEQKKLETNEKKSKNLKVAGKYPKI